MLDCIWKITLGKITQGEKKLSVKPLSKITPAIIPQSWTTFEIITQGKITNSDFPHIPITLVFNYIPIRERKNLSTNVDSSTDIFLQKNYQFFPMGKITQDEFSQD